MKKIISLFQRNYDGDRLVRDEVVPGAEWVLAGEGVATQKHDGTCCLFRDGTLYKRHTVKRGKKTPPDFEPTNEVNEHTGKQEGWVPVSDSPEDRRHREALLTYTEGHGADPSDGTYELCGPKVQGNPENFSEHMLVQHGCLVFARGLVPRTYDALKEFLAERDIEGIVWHHLDGRMVKMSVCSETV